MDETPDQGKSFLAEGLTPLHLSGCWRHVTSQASSGLKVSRNGGLVFRFLGGKGHRCRRHARLLEVFWKRFESWIRRQFNSCSKCRKSAPEGGAEFVDWGILTVPILMIPIGLMCPRLKSEQRP